MSYKTITLSGLLFLLSYYSHAQRQESIERLRSALSNRKTKELNSENFNKKIEYLNENAQNRLHAKDSVYFYLDSIRIDYDKYVIGTHSIASIYVTRDSTYKRNRGKIFISLKKGTTFKSFNGIVKEHIKSSKHLIASYIIDEKVNVDTVGVKIDISCIKQAKMIKDSFKKKFIITTTDFEKRKSYKKRNKDDEPLLIIR